ncbi:MAG: IS200/IS605 family transposase [Bacteroidetes bacterium]|nr:IS200/IS605 family transposase [Bacteroidota bacterium]
MKKETHAQVYIHLILAVRTSEYPLDRTLKGAVAEIVGSVLEGKNQVPIAINGSPDHLHILFSANPDCPLADTIRDIKRTTSFLINKERLFPGKFGWQKGYGAFSYGQSNLQAITRYIENQEEIHRKKTFREEFIQFLNAFGIEYDERELASL